MSDGPITGAEPDAGARAAARDRAREVRDLHEKQDKRRRAIVRGGIAAGLLLIVAVVTFVFVYPRDGYRGPENMSSDGIRIGADLKAVRSPGLEPGETPQPYPSNPPSVVDIQLYVDYLCAACGQFEESNGAQLRSWAMTGAATVEIHPIAMLTNKSQGTQYSQRAAAVAACVADLSPDHFLDFHQALLTRQPEEGSEGLTDQEMLDRAEAAGVSAMGQIRRCVSENRFRSWVKAATARALEGPIPGASIENIDAPLVILVNGQRFIPTTDMDPAELAQVVVQAAGDAAAENPTPTPTPTPTP
ncbi:MAG: thioredoxin domain-containing protein [Microbacteriaceae bacterium]|nr:thioredoxin domain-containing protein [Microbacteriaceae bacterium]